MPTTTLVATMRNEGPYILEWVAYHRLIGFDDLIVCSNHCEDGSPELLDLLARRGLLTHLPCAPGPEDQPQLFAYRVAQDVVDARRPEWIMVLDTDEYLNVHVGDGSVSALVAAVPEATAFLLNWRVFGNSGFDTWSETPVIGRYTMAAALQDGVNWSYKTLFTHADAYHCPLLPHGPGYAREERLGELRPVNGAGEPLPERFARSEGFLQSEPHEVSWALAQVNHYNTRSWDDYLIKHDRGSGLSYDRWDRDWNWRAFNKNDEEDRTIQRHLRALEARLAELKADPEIAAANDRCCALYGAKVEALRRAAA